MTISDQIRNAIKTSGASRYALAQAAGVSESALSRFMAGKAGLTLESIDRMATVLGIQIVTTVQQTPRPVARGRKPKEAKVPTTTKRTGTDWMVIAKTAARDAGENHFESRRGQWELEDDDGIVIVYNNNPYDKYPALRDDETDRLRTKLKKAGMKELAYAVYPETGKDAGYTFALVVDLGRRGTADQLADMYREVVNESFDRMQAKK